MNDPDHFSDPASGKPHVNFPGIVDH